MLWHWPGWPKNYLFVRPPPDYEEPLGGEEGTGADESARAINPELAGCFHHPDLLTRNISAGLFNTIRASVTDRKFEIWSTRVATEYNQLMEKADVLRQKQNLLTEKINTLRQTTIDRFFECRVGKFPSYLLFS